MKDSPGTFHHSPALKSKLAGIFCCQSLESKHDRLDSKLQMKMVEIKRRASRDNSFRSVNSIILKFPQFKEGLKEIRSVFVQYDEDNNATIDREELKKCLHKLQLTITEAEIDDLFHACDINENEGIQLNEFIVLLCLIYFLADFSTASHNKSKMLSPELEGTFSNIIEAFLFLDKNGDGKLNKKDMVEALNDASPWERSPSHVTRTRFSIIKIAIKLCYCSAEIEFNFFNIFDYLVNAEEMDWNRKGKVSFREFLFAFIKWVGIDSDDEEIEVGT